MSQEAEIFCKQYMAYSRRLYALAYQILRNREAAEDIVQDVYLQLWQKRATLRHNNITSLPQDKDILPLLQTMTRNACIDMLRTTHSEVCEVFPEEADSAVESQIENRDQLRHVLALIKQLPTEQQRVVELRLIRSLEFAEIATLTGLEEGNIRVLLSRARKTLRELTLKNHII